MTGDAVVEVGDHPTAISAEHDPAVDLSLVVPTYDEADNIEPLLRSLHGVLTERNVGFEILVVDDDSPDRTWEVAGRLVSDLPGLRVIRRTGASGLATAVTCGWAHARGAILLGFGLWDQRLELRSCVDDCSCTLFGQSVQIPLDKNPRCGAG